MSPIFINAFVLYNGKLLPTFVNLYSQGVKTLKNNAIIMMTVIILMGRVERKPDVFAFED